MRIAKMPNLPSWLAEVKARLVKATAGPWFGRFMDGHCLCVHSDATKDDVIAVRICRTHDACLVISTENLDLIAHAPTDLSRAVALVEAAQRVVEKAEEVQSQWDARCVAYTSTSPCDHCLATKFLGDALAHWHTVVAEGEKTDA